jgi:hypothetical protein
VVTESEDATDDMPLGRAPSLDPIGREIARMKVGDALFAKTEATNEVAPRPRDRMWGRRVIILVAIFAVALVLSLLR